MGSTISDADKKKVVDRYVEAYNSFDIDNMMNLMHPLVEFRNISQGQVTVSTSGADELRALADESTRIFSSRRQTVTRFSSEGETAVVQIDFTGVAALDLPNGLKAGETLQLSGRTEFIFRDGRIIRLTDYS